MERALHDCDGMRDNAVRHTPIETIENGRLTRRTFIKGVGWITVISAASAGLGGVGQARSEERR